MSSGKPARPSAVMPATWALGWGVSRIALSDVRRSTARQAPPSRTWWECWSRRCPALAASTRGMRWHLDVACHRGRTAGPRNQRNADTTAGESSPRGRPRIPARARSACCMARYFCTGIGAAVCVASCVPPPYMNLRETASLSFSRQSFANCWLAAWLAQWLAIGEASEAVTSPRVRQKPPGGGFCMVGALRQCAVLSCRRKL